MSEGHYIVKYKLEKVGVYKLNILIDKKHVGKSPYTLNCTINKLNGQSRNRLGMISSKSSYSIRENDGVEVHKKMGTYFY